jgi:hypothetical protein
VAGVFDMGELGGLPEGHFTPTYASTHLPPGSTAYGSTHPIDRALGRAYRLRSLHSASRGDRPTASSKITEASAIMRSGHMLHPQQFPQLHLTAIGAPSGL